MAMDQLGGNGNGSAWFSSNDAAITNHPLYHKYSQQTVATIDIPTLKGVIGDSLASSESSPILNYLLWVHTVCLAVA